MATWQFQLQIISKSEVEKNFGVIPEILGEDEIEKLAGWKKETFPSDKVYSSLSRHLCESKSWSDDIRQWGKEESNCFELIFSNKQLEEVVVRIDLRHFNDDLVNLVIEISDILDGLIVVNNRTYTPSFNNVMNELVKSDANRFVDNPIKYLDGLDK